MEFVPKLLMGIGTVVAAGGATIAIAQGPHVLLILRTFRGKPAPLGSAVAGPVYAQGMIQAIGAPLTSFDDGRELVFRYLDVHESGTGKHPHLQHYRGSAWTAFCIDDGTGAAEIVGEGATVLSAKNGMGPVTEAVDAFIGHPKYRCTGSRRNFLELGLSPGDFVSVRGDLSVQSTLPGGKPRRAIARSAGTALYIIRGEPRVLATTEGRLMLWGAVAVPVGIALAAAGRALALLLAS